MISFIIDSLQGSIECLQLFEKIYPLVEQKEMSGKTELGYYRGKGEYETVLNFDKYNGVCYFRLLNDIEVARIENQNKACADVLGVKYTLRCVCVINKDQLPEDCAFSDESFAWIIEKELTGRGGSLKRALGARSVFILGTKIRVDRKKILSEELPGDKITDINYNLCYVAIDFEINIEIQKSCIALVCDTYYTTVSSDCVARSLCNSNNGIDFVDLDVVDNQYEYTIDDLLNKRVLWVKMGGGNMEEDQYTKPIASKIFTITDTVIPMATSGDLQLKFRIFYQ